MWCYIRQRLVISILHLSGWNPPVFCWTNVWEQTARIKGPTSPGRPPTAMRRSWSNATSRYSLNRPRLVICTASIILFTFYLLCLLHYLPWLSASRPLHWSEQADHSEGFSCSLQVPRAGHQSLWERGPHLNNGISFDPLQLITVFFFKCFNVCCFQQCMLVLSVVDYFSVHYLVKGTGVSSGHQPLDTQAPE